MNQRNVKRHTESFARALRAALREDDVPRLASTGALVLEDCDRAEGHEQALFHLLNIAREKKCFVLLTARTPPGDWGIKTMDLLSRLRLAPAIEIGEPDDALVRGTAQDPVDEAEGRVTRVQREPAVTGEHVVRDTALREHRIIASVPHRDVKVKIYLERFLPLTEPPASGRFG